MKPKNQIEQWFDDNPHVQAAYAAFSDGNGTPRGKRLPAAQARELGADHSIRLPLSAAVVDIWGRDIEGSPLVFESGDIDGLCEITSRGVIPQPWTTPPSALIQLWLKNEDGSPFLADPRRQLQDVLDRYAVRGLHPVVATEMEFYLTDTDGDIPTRPTARQSGRALSSENILAISDLEDFDSFLNEVYKTAAMLDIPTMSAITEGGTGQFEINLDHTADVLTAADNAWLFKRMVRGIARKHNHAATFMAKPFINSAGSGFHVHCSVLDDDGNNVFDDGTEDGSDTMRYGVGGLITTMADSTLIFAPHINSYRRFTANSHAPTQIAWGYENRTAAIRIPGGSNAARRIEHRVAGADTNPYLVLATVLASILYGIENKIQPPEPFEGNVYESDADQIPLDWSLAIDQFEASTIIPELLSPLMHQTYTSTKSQEFDRFQAQISRFEYQTYLEIV